MNCQPWHECQSLRGEDFSWLRCQSCKTVSRADAAAKYRHAKRMRPDDGNYRKQARTCEQLTTCVGQLSEGSAWFGRESEVGATNARKRPDFIMGVAFLLGSVPKQTRPVLFNAQLHDIIFRFPSYTPSLLCLWRIIYTAWRERRGRALPNPFTPVDSERSRRPHPPTHHHPPTHPTHPTHPTTRPPAHPSCHTFAQVLR